MKANLFYLGIISFALGIVFRSNFVFNLFFITFLALMASAFFVYGLFLSFQQHVLFRVMFGSAFVLSLFILGVVRFHISDFNQGDTQLERFIGDSVVLIGVVTEEPDQRENNTRLTVDFKEVEIENGVRHVDSRGIVTTDFYPEFFYGDRIRLEGKLQKPSNFSNDLGKEFDYISFLAKDGIFYQMFRPKIEVLGQGEGNVIKEKVFAFKDLFLQKIKDAIPEPESSLAGGLLLGTKQSLGKETLDNFRIAGLIHIVVLSGYNITIVAESLMWFFSYFLRRRLASGFGILSIVMFALMTGAGATVIRASIMASLVLVARLSGRTFNALRALFFAGFIMLIHNPKILLFDPSFQLSFMATFGLITLSPLILKYIRFVPERFGFRELTASTISTQIFVLPLLLYMMGELSLVGLPTNLLVLPFVPYAMLLSFVTGVFGFIFAPLSLPFGFLAYVLLAYMFKVVAFVSSFSFASIKIPYFPLWLMVLTYGVYGYVLWKKYKQTREP